MQFINENHITQVSYRFFLLHLLRINYRSSASHFGDSFSPLIYNIYHHIQPPQTTIIHKKNLLLLRYNKNPLHPSSFPSIVHPLLMIHLLPDKYNETQSSNCTTSTPSYKRKIQPLRYHMTTIHQPSYIFHVATSTTKSFQHSDCN